MTTEYEQRRFECINNHLKELETLQVLPVKGIEYAECPNYAVHGDFPKIYEPFRGTWGGVADSHAWFRFPVEYPSVKDGQEVCLKIFTGVDSGWDANNPQMLVFYDGKAVRSVDVNHTEFPLPLGVKEVVLYAYTGTDVTKTLGFQASVVVSNKKIRAYRTKLSVLLDILKYQSEESKTRSELTVALKESVCAIDFTAPHSQAFYDSLERADKIVTEKCADHGEKPVVWSVGHTHIDIAWLWSKAQTKEKALRSFGTALELCDRYPDYKFISSQPILYEFVKEQDPAMYERIKEKVKSGQWEAEGAMWVEADCNLSSGESLVRQVLVGKKFFKDEFGVDSKILWLPDVFGYSANLPQILEKSGVEKFVTSKISWNEYNRMPHEIFRWQGIDGTKTLAYFMTTQAKIRDEKSFGFVTYNGAGTPSEVEGTYFRLSDKELTDDVLMPYGFGDGGGGTTPEMVERVQYLSTGVKGCAKTKLATATEFFEKLDENLNGKKLPEWVGELYLEFHRGTYTSIAKNKRNNRKAEFAIWRTEWLSALDTYLTGKTYPQETLFGCLKTLLTNQFHDILPGSSIKQVYDETDKDYAQLFATLGDIENRALTDLANGVEKEGVIVFNPNSYIENGTVVLDGKTVGVKNIPSKGYTLVEDLIDDCNVVATADLLENDFFKVRFNKNGEIVSLIDKLACREVVKENGALNKIVAYEDLPFEYDNWELKEYYKEKPVSCGEVVGVEIVQDGVRKGVRFTKKYFSSTLVQTVWMYQHINRIDFETNVDWHEHHIVLRMESETSVRSDKATFEIQYGSLQRTAHDNTSWDRAKFETCAHKYVDVSEYGYGFALLNDCKYGHSVRGGAIGLTLLKSGTHPNPEADQGKHEFTYSFMPHTGDYREAGCISQAYLLNNPLIAVRGNGSGTLPARYSAVEFDNKSIATEVVKEAEDGSGFVVRAYESFGGTARTTAKFGMQIQEVYECNLLEQNRVEIAHENNSISCVFTPYEIKTFYIKTCKK